MGKNIYCPALLTLEVGRARHKAFAILWQLKGQYFRNSSEIRTTCFFPKNCCQFHFSFHLPDIHHPHLLCPVHHLRLLYHLLHHLLYIYIYIYTIIITIIIIIPYICPPKLPTPPTHFSINLIYITCLIYNTYNTYIIIYITTSSTSPTASHLLHHLLYITIILLSSSS